jgi:ABC-type polysaccharide/polyol phosphate export permease
LRRALSIGLVLGWQDIKQSYRRSVLGQLWITIGMAVTIAAIGIVFGTIFGAPVQTYLPYLASGLIMWGLISHIVNEGTSAFIAAQSMILQLPLPKIAHLLRVVWRNLILSAHNIILLPIVIVIVGGKTGWSILLWPLGLSLGVTLLTGLSLSLSVLASRFRDFPPIVSSIMTVAFYLSPVIWVKTAPGQNVILDTILVWNPFYHVLQIMRMPLIGELPTYQNWIFSLVLLVILWIIGLLLFSRYEKRIAYWS